MEKNNEKIGEQPCVVEPVFEQKMGEENELGSPFGKFKTAESLLDAYNNLQSEFTKKCQKISELQKNLDEINDNVAKNQSEDNLANGLEQTKKIAGGDENLTDKKATPLYLQDGWQDKVNEFVTTHKYAINIMTELAEVLKNDSQLACDANCLDLAYNQILAQKFRREEDLLESEDFVNNYILNNEKIKMKVITNYLSELNREKTPPVISEKRGSYTSLNSRKKISSLSEAKQVAELLFNF